MFLRQDHTSPCCVSCLPRAGDGAVGGGEGGVGWGSLMMQLHAFHLSISHNVQHITVFVTARSLVYAFRVFHCEVRLKVVLITLLTAEPYGFSS